MASTQGSGESEPGFPHVSLVEGVRFTAQVGLPAVTRGLFAPRAVPGKVAAAVNADKAAFDLIAGLVRKHGPGPFYVRVGATESLLLSAPEDIRFVLEESPRRFTSAPEAKRKGMTAFQPEALTLSTGARWQERRTFAETVLDTGVPVHRLAPRILAVASEEARALSGALTWEPVNEAFRRITRRVLFGDEARSDTALSTLLDRMMVQGNKMPGTPAHQYNQYLSLLHEYLDDPPTESLARLVVDTPLDTHTDRAGQMIHWMFAMGDTLPANVLRALAAMAVHPDAVGRARSEIDDAAPIDPGDPAAIASLRFTGACISEAMRLWPTTPMFGRVAVADVEFPDGRILPAGTEVLINNLFNHRNSARLSYADSFSPGEWVEGDAASYWGYNFFSHGPQVCPGADLSMFIGQAVVATILTDNSPGYEGPKLTPDKLPYSLDIDSIKIPLTPRNRSPQ